MSTSVGLYGASGTAYVLQQAVSTLTDKQTALVAQATTGVTSDTYAGLGDQRGQALSLQPQITAISTWQTSVSGAQTNLSVTQSALTQISSLNTTLQTDLLSLNGTYGQETLATVVESAKTALSELGDYLNTKGSNGYVFAGTDVNNAPVPDASNLATSTLATVTSDAVSQLDTLGASSVFQTATSYAASGGTYTTTDNTTVGLSVFSSALSTDPSSAEGLETKAVVGQGAVVNVGMVATEGTTPTSSQTTTTGSPIRDLMRNLMIVASLGNADTSSSNFSDLVDQLKASTSTVGTELSNQVSSLALTQNSLTAQSTNLSTMSTMLTSQLSDIKDVDIAAVSVQTGNVQDQLLASYTLISDLKGMTLADYI
ncbi:flagellar hook-associated protein FlgL [Acetobacter aceti NRIC 0242]|uniref:Flagellar hook-associated protein FlgL n=1 Tax=Acetobacter aceti NBRC 14818 TaxID=887700 RepID=A0AB33IB78_ACEAC|nr:flagellin [Acetobacter aceti]TCS35261.1 flagellar hook-associated protein 3 FlgL [Acetobacter aceti NBRC 14818]BCK75351.1 flagellar hook-associated protein FlgL [Acetobacter aceti NBRC 14818]GAN57359.1 flagellar hook-associated protein FlgL [Acetobacter aceti NBRC 14818]GBO81463.1 flagellar hook-associated protein FlgL [Acetobacter aceti NRIC 0242]